MKYLLKYSIKYQRNHATLKNIFTNICNNSVICNYTKQIKKFQYYCRNKIYSAQIVHTLNATFFNEKMFVLDFSGKVIFISSVVENYHKMSF